VDRFFLGAVEAGIVPAIIMYLSSWYKRDELQTRIGYFWGAASLSGAVGGLLAAAISNLAGHAGLEGWSWIFIIEGMRSCPCIRSLGGC
jgi:MFS family permease